MKLLLKRDSETQKSTLGKLYIDGIYECETLEDVDRKLEIHGAAAKVYGQTAIPRGVYPLVLKTSIRFKRVLPLLLDVPYFTGIRIHTGNKHEDTDGCILVGTTRSADFVGNSREAFSKLFIKLENAQKRGEQIVIEVA